MLLEMLLNNLRFLNYDQGRGICQFGTLELRSALQCGLRRSQLTLLYIDHGINERVFNKVVEGSRVRSSADDV